MPTDDMRMVRDGWMGGGGDDDDCSIRVIVDVIMIMCRRLETALFSNLALSQLTCCAHKSIWHPAQANLTHQFFRWHSDLERGAPRSVDSHNKTFICSKVFKVLLFGRPAILVKVDSGCRMSLSSPTLAAMEVWVNSALQRSRRKQLERPIGIISLLLRRLEL